MRGEVSAGQGFRARAGVLTVMLTCSGASRRSLLGLLAQQTMGVRVMDDVPELSEEEAMAEMVADSYLLEAADSSMLEPDGSIGPATPLRPTAAGRELAAVGFALNHWLESCPEGPQQVGDGTGGAMVAALIGGWAAGAAHRIAVGPQTIAELGDSVPGIQEALLEDRVTDMRTTSLAETWVDEDGESRHELTEWGREAVVPLALAMRLECRHPREDTMAPDHRDAEAILGCALPLIQLDPRLEGSCRLAFRLPGARIDLAGVTAHFEAGQLLEIGTDLEEPCDSAAVASSDAWLEALASGEAEAIEVDGEPTLVHGILEAVHEQLFAGLPKL